ncbi:Putative DNA mismatch repair protein MutS, core [Septoria linicola]|uniref:DNA mismatch repair protein MutS, core n=1 Tax=Septoria linicola TaxID=215465 RepID=A0A9Q9EPE2_9PEZI|nr:putative DNA mismatch repair protein MutS, core [Septoria linicola]USW57617.1 Putative DNA mismatch repair protein MutS, core [Septoria linicola]
MGGKRRRQSTSYSGYSTSRDEQSISHDQTVTYYTTTRRISHNDNTGYKDDTSRSLYDDPNHNDTTESRPWTEASRPNTARPRTGVSTLGIENQEIICAISEARGFAPTVGLAFINLDTGEAVLSQFSDSQTYVKTVHKLMVFNPSNICIVSTSSHPKSKLFSIIEERLDEIGCNLTLLDRKYWAETVGFEYIQQLGFPEDIESIKTAVTGNWYAVCCFAAALKFTELGMMKTFPYHSLRIKYEPSEGSMMIDLGTMRSLELVQNLCNPKSKDCLLGLLNETLTPMGMRLLRSNILQPITSQETLNKRYDVVEELSTKEDMFFSVRTALKPFLDVDRTLTQLIVVPTKPSLQDTEKDVNNIIMLKHFVTHIKPMWEALAGCRSEMLREIQRICAPEMIESALDLIASTINEDTMYATQPLDLRNQRTYAVKSGVNGLLDVARQTYKESMTDAFQHISDICEEYNLPFQTKYDPARSFYLRLRVGDLEDRRLPGICINTFRKKDNIECQTLELVQRNQKVNDAHTEVMLMSDRSVKELIADVREHMSGLFKVCECVAMLDMLASFAHLVSLQDYSRPAMSKTLCIRAGRHPIREKVHNTKYIPNDVYATRQMRFQIITGCNMSGKSTYIRSVAMMTIMAQVGSFVPAQYATFPIIRQLFARVSMDDDIEANVSTFAAEMRETAFILKYIDEHSMAIVDELGRGTSTRDGLGIAIAIAEALVESRALVWFATHFRDLSNILSERNGVVDLHLAVIHSPKRMQMLYKVASGTVKDEHYGLKIAKVLPLPRDVIEHAEHVSYFLEAQVKQRKEHSLGVVTARRRKLLLNLEEHLRQAQESAMSDENLKKWLLDLQVEFINRMSALAEEETKIQNGGYDDEGGGGDDDGIVADDSASQVPANDTASRSRASQSYVSYGEDLDEDKENRPPPSSTNGRTVMSQSTRMQVNARDSTNTDTGRSVLGTSSRHFTNTNTS